MSIRPKDIPTVIAIEDKYKLEAQKRNGQATLIVILMVAIVALVIISAISYIEIQISRFSDSLVYDIVITCVISTVSIAYACTIVALKSMRIWPLHDTSINENNTKQYGLLMFYVPCIVTLLIAVRWIGYAKSNDDRRFQDMPGGVQYSWISQATWFLSLIVLFTILYSMFSFYRVRQPIYRFSLTRGIPWSKQANEVVRPEYDVDTNSTILVPKKELLL